MKPREEVKREFVQQWLKKAEEDFHACKHLISGGAAHVYGSVFHAQQSAEKFLKALLVWHQVEFPKTHAIEQLLELVATFDSELAHSLREASILSPYGVEYRYPGDFPDVAMADAEKGMQLAGKVREEILKRLPQDLRP